MEGQKIWGGILSGIKTQVSQSTYKTWFSGSFVLDFKQNGEKELLIIGVKNNFLKGQIESRYSETISQIARECGFPRVEVVFVVASRQSQKATSEEPLFSGVIPEVMVGNGRMEVLNTANTFDNFVVGPSNNLALLASQQVAANPGSVYNPLLLYGPTGVGKTHLVQAIGNEISSKFVDSKVLYVTAEKFTNDYIDSLRNRTQASFRQKYRSLGLLLVDDIQFFSGKESTQDEFFHTFNDLYLSGRQIVLACDRPPKEMGRLKERLVSRLVGGMTADIGFPDLEMRVAILKTKCQERKVDLGDENITYIASSTGGGIRELEGIFVSVLALSRLSGGQVTLDQVKMAVGKYKFASEPKATAEKVFDAVCQYFKVKRSDICGSSRKASLVWARQILMYLLRQELNLSYVEVGDFVGGRDHSTIIYAVEKIGKQILNNQNSQDEVLRVRSLI